jgi:hypothetical protein
MLTEQASHQMTSGLLEGMDQLFYLFTQEVAESIAHSSLSGLSQQQLVYQKIAGQSQDIAKHLESLDWTKGLMRLQQEAKKINTPTFLSGAIFSIT